MKSREVIFRIIMLIITLTIMLVTYILRERIGAPHAIFQVILLVIGSYTIAPCIAFFLGIKSGELYTGNKRQINTPLLSKAESLAANHNFEEAVILYREIQIEFPDYLPLYHPLLRILSIHLQDQRQAREVYRIGWMAMEGEKRAQLEHLYKEFSASSEK